MRFVSISNPAPERGVVTDAGAAGEFTQRKLKTPGFKQDFQRGLDDYAAQVAVVVGALMGLGLRHRSTNL
jgi:hypothetical protein